jgi:3-oxoacyl-[acyl-carrier-protein] synthase-3
MPYTRIAGTGHCIPERVVTNDELAGMMDTTDEWIQQRTGIRERHWIREGESGTGLAKIASERALAAAQVAVGDVEAILFATVSPDHMAPGNGVFLQRELGAGMIPAIDIRTQCSGFIYSLSIADAYIRAGVFRTILVVGAEVQSTGMDITTRGRNTAVIFADGAGAVVLQAHDDPAGSAILGWDLHSDGTFAEKLWVDAPGAIYHPRNQAAHIESKGFASMDGKEVFRHASTRMPESVRAALSHAGLAASDIALLIPHQANLRISEMVQRNLDLRDDQVYNNIDRLGNTTAATIPIALDECVRAGRLKRGDILAMTAFGSGFLWGSAVLRW